ncbi:MAG: alpha/beta hydrolase [Fibrobacteria bacterium]|nr:alpha/beta hydrolase [Fibrobacteria bacterium]
MDTKRPLIWIGGWASDLQSWENHLGEALEGFSPRFISAHVLLEGAGRLRTLLDSLSGDAVLAGWSLGALLVERMLREGMVPEGMPVVRICPFLDFCSPAGTWTTRHLRLMAHRLYGDPHGVLEDFANLAGIPAGPLRQLWLDHATALGEDNLVDGLQLLGSLRLESPWVARPGGFIVSPDDRVSPKASFPEESTEWMPPGSGHVPFLVHGEAFNLALHRLAGS